MKPTGLFYICLFVQLFVQLDGCGSARFQAEPQPYRSMGASLLDGVQPLFLGGLLRLKLGLLLRIGLSGDLGVKFGELCVELLLEGGLTGVGFRIGLPEWRPMPGEPAWRPSHP